MGLSQAAFGRLIGVSRGAIYHIENGGTKALKGSTIVAIEKTTGFSGQWVETGKGAPHRADEGLPKDLEDQVAHIYAEFIKLPKAHRDRIEAEIDFLRSLNKDSE